MSHFVVSDKGIKGCIKKARSSTGLWNLLFGFMDA